MRSMDDAYAQRLTLLSRNICDSCEVALLPCNRVVGHEGAQPIQPVEMVAVFIAEVIKENLDVGWHRWCGDWRFPRLVRVVVHRHSLLESPMKRMEGGREVGTDGRQE